MLQFLNTPDDCQWLRETHLRALPQVHRFASFVMAGNEDAPDSVDLYTMQPEFTFTHAGLEFNAYVEADDRNEAPWENEDGHGPVRVISHRLGGAKRPGERVLHTDGHTTWLYDWQAACAMARTDGWNAAPYDAPGRIERAVTADFKRLRDWLRGEWFYVGVCVTRAGEDEDERYAHAVWGIESDSPDYHREVATGLAAEIVAAMPSNEPALSYLD